MIAGLRVRAAAVAGLLWLGVPGAPAAELRELPAVSYGPERGLSGHPVTAVAQDARGRLWVSTLGGGVLRYDGLVWRQITSRDGLPSDRVTAVVATRAGRVWVSTAPAPGSRGGLCFIEGDRVTPVEEGLEVATGFETAQGVLWLARAGGGVLRTSGSRLERVPGLETVEVQRIREAPDGIWFLGRGRGEDAAAAGRLARFDGSSFRTFGPGDGLPTAPFHGLAVDAPGQLWLATGSGLYALRGGRFEAAALAGAATARNLYAISPDADGSLWIGADGAVLRIEKDTVSELKLPLEVGPQPVLAVQASPASGVFLMTPSSLLRLEGSSIEVLPLEERGALLPPGDASDRLKLEATLDEALERNGSLLLDLEGGVWAIAGRRLVRYAGDEARRFGRDEGLPSDDVAAVLVDSRGRVWAGTAAGAARMIPEVGFFEPVSGSREKVTALNEDRSGAVYAATGKGVLRIDGLSASPWEPASGVPRTNAFAADSSGTLWMGTEAGVVRAASDGLRAYTTDHGLAPGPVLSLDLIDGELWAGHASGASHYTGTRFESVAALEGMRVEGLIGTGSTEPPRLLAVTAQGLVAVPAGVPVPPKVERTRLYAAHRSASGVLWLATDLGLVKYAEGAEVLHSGGGFPADPVRAFAEEPGGRLWLATARGLYRHTPRRHPPTVWIGRVLVEGRERPVDQPIAIDGACRDVLVRLEGVSFVGPRDGADLRFQSRLLPAATSWSAAGYERERNLTGLRPGSYRLEVRSVSRDLLVSEPAAIDLVVGKPEEMPPPAKLILPPIAR